MNKKRWILITLVLVILTIFLYLIFQNDIKVPQVVEKPDLIRVTSLKSGDIIKNPFRITGEARGYWYFEASFPVLLYDSDGRNIPLNPPYITAVSNWMTEDFVPFDVMLEFMPPATATGTLVLQKDNPSGLPENDDSLAIPVRFR
ncbi:MAG TPA: Gmad2 immunoglobulin-like domain-containing protein [Candidatus Paceibacterota bacterium]|nr:Gmad2 immunoglobulin-like domain-containing protein [Candidatus Paceibacterota bacterium]